MTTARAFRSPAASAWRPRTSLWPLLTALLACHAGRTTSTRSSVDPAAGYTATLTRDGGSWIVDYQFPEPQSALLFDTQHGAYRTRYWTPLDARTKLVNLDGLFFDVPVREARIRIRPPTEPVAGTRPFLRFSDGSLAFYTGQLALLTVEDRRAAEALHGDSSSWHGHLKALKLWPQGNTWGGGGVFYRDAKQAPPNVALVWDDLEEIDGDRLAQGLATDRLRRDGWTRLAKAGFTKPINKNLTLQIKPVGARARYGVIAGDAFEARPAWTWADVDATRKRLLWAEAGVLRAAPIKAHGLGNPYEIYDARGMTFEPIAAPYRNKTVVAGR